MEQATAGEDVLVRRQMAVVRLVAYIARRRDGNSFDEFSVVFRVLVEVDDCEKVGIGTGLVPGPDKQVPFVI